LFVAIEIGTMILIHVIGAKSETGTSTNGDPSPPLWSTLTHSITQICKHMHFPLCLWFASTIQFYANYILSLKLLPDVNNACHQTELLHKL